MRRMMSMNASSEKNIRQLAKDIVDGKRVLFITGAGLSVASGISTYRSSGNSIWNNFVLSWGTRKKFESNPLEWWNHFWLKTHETKQFLNAKPNEGHRAIARIVQRSSARVVTQNIDRLHQATLTMENRVVEVHGRLGLYKCINPKCHYTWHRSIPSIDYEKLAVPGTSLDKENLLFKEAPLCPGCGIEILPQSLLFDELYGSHSFYQFEKALEWFDVSDVYVFVGTSFSVGVTAEAIERGLKFGKKMYNFNLLPTDDPSWGLMDIVGPSEMTLPYLDNLTYLLRPRPRLYFYPIPHQFKKKLRQNRDCSANRFVY